MVETLTEKTQIVTSDPNQGPKYDEAKKEADFFH
jgi:hypothetical protein